MYHMCNKMNTCEHIHFPSLLDHYHQHSNKLFISPIKKKISFWSHSLPLVISPFFSPLLQQTSSRDLIYSHFLQFFFSASSKSILICFCPTNTLLINITIDFDLDKSFRHNCHASSLKYFSSLSFQYTTLVFLLHIASPSQSPCFCRPYSFTTNYWKLSGFHPCSLSTFTFVGVSFKLSALSNMYLPLTLDFYLHLRSVPWLPAFIYYCLLSIYNLISSEHLKLRISKTDLFIVLPKTCCYSVFLFQVITSTFF